MISKRHLILVFKVALIVLLVCLAILIINGITKILLYFTPVLPYLVLLLTIFLVYYIKKAKRNSINLEKDLVDSLNKYQDSINKYQQQNQELKLKQLRQSYQSQIRQLEQKLEQERSQVALKYQEREKGQAQSFTEYLGNDVELEMIAIPGGKFMMGSPEGEGEDNERSQHEVTVQPFFMGKYPITQAQYQQIMGINYSYFKGNGQRPVECVSWDEAVEFCQRLSKQIVQEYRLPTEAEWEYACRAGTTTPYYFGETITDKLVNYSRNVGETTAVGKYPPNAFGLYDMHGLVCEWCQDDWHDNYQDAPNDCQAWILGNSSYRVIRSCSWYDDLVLCRSAFRSYSRRDGRGNGIGFRVVCVAPRAT